MQTMVINKKRKPPHKNPKAALPSWSDINQENEITRNNIKNKSIKLVMKISNKMLRVFERTLMLFNLKISSRFSIYSFTSFLFSS